MAERTPGPWYVDSRLQVKSEKKLVANIITGYIPEAAANAHFIAAAPDMEKALEAWIEWDGEIREGLSPPMLARAALAKAKGEANA